MRKIMCFMFFAIIATIAWSQELHVASGGTLHISPKSYVYVNGDIDVDGTLAVNSDATDSGSLLVSGDADGNISYVRYIPSAKWHFVSAPVTTQSIESFATNAANGIKTNTAGTVYGISYYNNATTPTTRWQYYATPGNASALPLQNAGLASSAGNFVSGKGYSNLRATVGTYTFSGNMATNNVDISVPDNAATAEDHHFGVVGNPYPSFLAGNTAANASNVLSQNAGILKTGMVALYFWNGSTNSYDAINNSEPTALYIAPGQAFMVEAKADNQTFTFSKALQEPQPGASANFYRTAPMTAVTLYLSKGKEEKRTRLRYLDANVTLGLDEGYDAGSYRDGEPVFSIDTHLVSNSTGKDFTIQCLPKSDLETSVVPLSVYAQANDNVSFRVEAENLPEGVFVFLEDKENNTVKKLSDGAYTITINENLNGIGRFYLHTAQSVLSVDEDVVASNVSIYKTSNNVLRIAGLQANNKATIKVYSIAGKEVVAKTFKTRNINDVSLPNLSMGVYLVQVVSNTAKHTKKIIIE